jgi:hypothetical protein
MESVAWAITLNPNPHRGTFPATAGFRLETTTKTNRQDTNVVDLLQDGNRVTVDGYLGIVTFGPPEFRLELGVTENEPGAGLGRPSGMLPVGALDASKDSR